MNAAEFAAAYVAELERRWRARTPAPDIEAVLPATRVGRSEMRAWFVERYGRPITFDEEMDLHPFVAAMFKRLRREFPTERWG